VKPFRLALAQIDTRLGDVAANLDTHLETITRARRRGAVEVDGQAVLPAETLADAPRDGDGVVHREIAQWDEGQHVQRPQARVDAAVLPHVHAREHRVGERQRRLLDGLRGAEEGEDRAVVVGVGVDIGERHAGNAPHRAGDGLHGAQVAAFAHVRDALEEGARHGPVSYPSAAAP